jgi:VWFA-related protein
MFRRIRNLLQGQLFWVFCFSGVLTGSFAFTADKGDKTEKRDTPTKKNSEKSEPFTFRVPVDVVVVNVAVTDNQGKPLKDLAKDDFKVYEDGKSQPIHTFALESYKAVQEPSDGSKSSTPQATAQEDPGATQPRMISFVVDDLATSDPAYFSYVREAIVKTMGDGLGPSDVAGLITASGSVNQPFTSDRELLLSLAEDLYKKVNRSGVIKSDCPELTDLQAQQIRNDHSDPRPLQVAVTEAIICRQLDGVPNAIQMAEGMARSLAAQQYEENQYRYRGLLTALKQHVRSLRHFEAKKSLLLFSDGFLSDYVRYELQDVVDMCLRSGVVLNTVDARGLFTTNYEAKDNVITGVNQESFAILAQKPMLRIEDIRQQEDPLRQLSSETGGLHVANTNDLASGIRKVLDSQSYYYILTYSTPDPKLDGRYHKIKVEVSRPGVRVSYRKGYYAPKEQLTFERRKKEDILEALHAPGNLNEIPIQLSYNYFQVEDSRYQLALLTRVNIRGLKFVEEDSRHKNLINLVVVAFDENDHFVDGLEKSMDLNLTDPSYTALLSHGFTSKVDIKVPPGRYKIKAVVREGVHTKMGSINKTIEVP